MCSLCIILFFVLECIYQDTHREMAFVRCSASGTEGGGLESSSMSSFSDDDGGLSSSDGETFCAENFVVVDDSPRSASTKRKASPDKEPAAQAPKSTVLQWSLEPPVREQLKTWQGPLLKALAHVRYVMFTTCLLLRPLTHDALLCGNITEHYGFEARFTCMCSFFLCMNPSASILQSISALL
jgi:hypothetical protein